MKSLAAEQSADATLGVLSHFRVEFYDCLYTRADALFELTDTVLCSDGPVTSLVELTLTAEHRRGHGAMYDAVNHGWLEPRRRRRLASTPLPRAADGRIVLAVDVSNWLRPDAPTSPELLFRHVYGRGRSADQFIPGWPYSFVAELETGRTSWTAVLDSIRLREVVTRLVHVGSGGRATRTSSSSWTPATTSPVSPTSWPTCPSSLRFPRHAGGADQLVSRG